MTIYHKDRIEAVRIDDAQGRPVAYRITDEGGRYVHLTKSQLNKLMSVINQQPYVNKAFKQALRQVNPLP